MPVNTSLHREWQERQEHSLAKHYQRLAYDPKGQTLTKAERARAKARLAFQKKALANSDFDARGRRLDYVAFSEERAAIRRQHDSKFNA